MLLDRVQILEMVQNLPEKIETEEIIEKILLLENISEGLKDLKEDRLHSEEDANGIIDSWFR